jgi:hypothetical protein
MPLDRRLAAFATFLALAACEGSAPKQTPSEPPAPAADAPAKDAPATDAVAWKDMKHAARMEHMKTVVFPAMKAAFTAFDPDDFKDFKCATCHGAGAADKTFKMPNPKLPKLPADEAGFKQLAAKEGDAVKFMSETVVPKMAAMLGETPYDPATHQGFGCFECHTKKP